LKKDNKAVSDISPKLSANKSFYWIKGKLNSSSYFVLLAGGVSDIEGRVFCIVPPFSFFVVNPIAGKLLLSRA
jgi:hypothetical protein